MVKGYRANVDGFDLKLEKFSKISPRASTDQQGRILKRVK